MPKYTVWTNATDEKTITASSAVEAASKYHNDVGALPNEWDGVLHVRDEQNEEVMFRRREAA